MIGSSTPVNVTMGKLIGGVIGTAVLSGGALWVVLTFTIGGLRDDVGAIRRTTEGLNVAAITQAITNLQSADRDNITRANDISAKLSEQLNGLQVEMQKFSDGLEYSNKLLVGLSSRLDKMQESKVVTTSYDPKSLAVFAEYLRKSAGDNTKVIIVVPSPNGQLLPLVPIEQKK